jgi:hypothetical protein
MSGAADIRAWGEDIQAFARDAPGDAIRVVDQAIRDQLQQDTGGDGALSHGRDLGRATTQVRARDGEAQVDAAGSLRVWAILESGTSGHEVRAPRGHFLRTPYGPRPSVRVSGVPGRETFTRAAQSGLEDAQHELERAWGGL